MTIWFWISSSVSEVFAAELHSRPKSGQIFHVFRPWNFFGVCLPKFGTEKCTLGGYDSTSKSPRSLDQTSPDFFCVTQEESPYTEWLSEFEYLHTFRRYSPPNFEIVRNFVKFCMFFAPENFFGVRPQKFWTGIIKIGLVLTIVQNLRPVGPRISEISCSEKNKIKLEIWGKAQRESARRPKSHWGKLGGVKRGVKLPRHQVTCPEFKCIGIRRTRIVDLG